MPLSVTRVVNALLCSDELYCPLHQSGVAVAGETNAVNTKQSEAVTVSLFFPPHHPYPQAFCTLPSFAHIKRPRWRPVELNDRHLRSHGKIGDCEQSRKEEGAGRGGMFICSKLRQNLSEMQDRVEYYGGHCKDTESNLGPFASF